MVLESFRINHYNPAVKKRRPTAFFLLLGDPNNRTVPKDKRQEGRIRQFICRFGTEWHKYRRSPILGSDGHWNWSQNSTDGRAPINQAFTIIAGSPSEWLPLRISRLIANKSVPIEGDAGKRQIRDNLLRNRRFGGRATKLCRWEIVVISHSDG